MLRNQHFNDTYVKHMKIYQIYLIKYMRCDQSLL